MGTREDDADEVMEAIRRAADAPDPLPRPGPRVLDDVPRLRSKLQARAWALRTWEIICERLARTDP